MKIISNKDIPLEALAKLENYGLVLPYNTKDVTYPAISNHPDVFMCLVDNQLIIAPNTPVEYKKLLINNNVKFVEGNSEVANSYPDTAMYNAVVTDKYVIHNLKITDATILELCADKQAVNVNQAYTRCNLLPLKNDSFITSDKGIYNALALKKLNVLLVNPQGIILPGFDYGFFGGACGVYDNSIFLIGSLSSYNDGNKVAAFLATLGYEIIELYDGPLIDCGSLILLK